MSQLGPISAEWSRLDAERAPILNRARGSAALTYPWSLPPQNHNPSAELPENFQSLGSWGVTNVVGRMLMSLFPPGIPWHNLSLPDRIMYDNEVPNEVKLAAAKALFMADVLVDSALEGTVLKPTGAICADFRTAKRQAIEQLVIAGDVLEYLTDDYRLKVFRMDQYVILRDPAGQLLQCTVQETIDPLTLTDDQLADAKINLGEVQKKSMHERMEKMHTRCQWQPRTKRWLIEQEVCGYLVNVSEEAISPFFSTPFHLAPQAHYGRGFVESIRGDLRSFDEIRNRILDFADMATRMHPVLDASSMIRDTDFTKRTGQVIRNGRVQGGIVQDMAFMSLNKLADFQIAQATAEMIRRDLGKAFMLEAETAPTGEAGRSPVAWQRIAAELDGAMGGLYAPIAGHQQMPLLRRTLYQLHRDGILPQAIPEEHVELRIVTGLAALSRQAQRDRLLSFVQFVAAMGPQASARINLNVLSDILMRYENINEVGLIKDDAEVERETQSALAMQAQQAATEKGVDVIGNVAEQRLLQSAA